SFSELHIEPNNSILRDSNRRTNTVFFFFFFKYEKFDSTSSYINISKASSRLYTTTVPRLNPIHSHNSTSSTSASMAFDWSFQISLGGREMTLTILDTLAIGMVTAAVLLNVVSVLIPNARAPPARRVSSA